MIRIEIPGLPKRFNQGQGTHWRARHAHNRKWKTWVGRALIGQIPPQPYPKAELTLVRVSSVMPDFDGLVQSFKPIVDALKFFGVIIDDNMNVIGQPSYRWEKGKAKEGKVIVTVKEIT